MIKVGVCICMTSIHVQLSTTNLLSIMVMISSAQLKSKSVFHLDAFSFKLRTGQLPGGGNWKKCYKLATLIENHSTYSKFFSSYVVDSG